MRSLIENNRRQILALAGKHGLENVRVFPNMLTNSYFDIDENLVWVMSEQDLPVPKEAIGRMKNRGSSDD